MQITGTPRKADNISVLWEKQREFKKKCFNRHTELITRSFSGFWECFISIKFLQRYQTSPTVHVSEVCVQAQCPIKMELIPAMKNKVASSDSTPPWMRCLSISGLPPAFNSLVPIYTPGWSNVLWEESIFPRTQWNENLDKVKLYEEVNLEREFSDPLLPPPTPTGVNSLTFHTLVGCSNP